MKTDLEKRIADLGNDPLANISLPDCRTKDTSSPARKRQVFCANCSKLCMKLIGSWVEAESVFYICDDCDKKLGPIPGLVQIPEENLQ